ncbi:hypothetical protein [Mesorhizobium sp. M0185]|uniref:hypothetical protein n=1 Tax=unclassified Mesorhizobium TaxID=325217 RepID=UPI00333BFDAB
MDGIQGGAIEWKPGIKVRFRFRVAKMLALEKVEHEFEISGRTATLTGLNKEELISESYWLVVGVSGFKSEEEAKEFGQKLKIATSISSLFVRLGIDVGHDRGSGQMSADILAAMKAVDGKDRRSDVHGIDVYVDDGTVGLFKVSATGVVRTQPDPFLPNIGQLIIDQSLKLPDSFEKAVLLLNAALMNPEPLAQLVLALSTVEGLGQQEEWSLGQKQLITHAAEVAKRDTKLSQTETEEVVKTIMNHSHRLSLRQGVLRVLEKSGLSDLKKEWDDVYGYRSVIFHEGRVGPNAEYSAFANRAVALCGHIILKNLEPHLKGAADMADSYFPIQKAT